MLIQRLWTQAIISKVTPSPRTHPALLPVMAICVPKCFDNVLSFPLWLAALTVQVCHSQAKGHSPKCLAPLNCVVHVLAVSCTRAIRPWVIHCPMVTRNDLVPTNDSYVTHTSQTIGGMSITYTHVQAFSFPMGMSHICAMFCSNYLSVILSHV